MKQLTLIFGLLLTLGSTTSVADTSDVLSASVQDLTVQAASFDVTTSRDQSFVTSLGSIKNASPAYFDEIVVEVSYFDANKALVDTVTQPLYDIVVPPSQEVAFRVRDIAAKPKAAYTSQAMRVASATSRFPSQKTASRDSMIYNLFVSLGPMLLLIGVWIFFVQRMRGKNSPQERSLALVQQHINTVEAQIKVLERIAVAIEEKGRRES